MTMNFYDMLLAQTLSGGGGDDAMLIDLIERNITTIKIPEGCKKIGANAFRQCSSLVSVDIPETVTELVSNCFASCTSLSEITCRAIKPPSASATSVFTGVPGDCAIYVPEASVDAYKSANIWSSRASYIQAIPE